MESSKLLSLLKETGAILEGHFLLTSGQHSPIYIEKFRILENPYALDKVCNRMAKIVENENIDIILGAAIGGILIAGGVGRYLGKKHIFSERINSKMELRRGFSISKGQRIIIVEDIITTGGSINELIDLSERCSAEIIHIVNLVDRSLGGIKFNYPSSTLLNIPSDSFEAENCPLCQEKIPLTQRGRTGKR